MYHDGKLESEQNALSYLDQERNSAVGSCPGDRLPCHYCLFDVPSAMFRKAVSTIEGLTSFPILLGIAVYERQAKKNHTIGFYSTFSAIAEKAIDTLPRQFKRLSKSYGSVSLALWILINYIAFFDGLAGADADIDAIFEIEEEASESALDTSDYPMSPVDGPRDRRLSPTKRGTKLPSPPSANRQHTGPARDAPRTRVASLLSDAAHNAAHAVSPLAQLFQPLIVDDSIPEESETGTEDGQAHQLHVVLLYPRSATAQPVAGGMRKFPGTSGSANTDYEHPMSESPSLLEDSASQVKKDEGDDMGNTSSQVKVELDENDAAREKVSFAGQGGVEMREVTGDGYINPKYAISCPALSIHDAPIALPYQEYADPQKSNPERVRGDCRNI
ncbi:Calcium channel YVC [Salix suchowensis]|nr:Calcium channel YVC [Salix suchowensis]